MHCGFLFKELLKQAHQLALLKYYYKVFKTFQRKFFLFWLNPLKLLA